MISKNKLKFIKSLKVKKYRLREKRFVVEGTKNVLELLKSSYTTDLILTTKVCYEANKVSFDRQNFEIVSEKMLGEAGTFRNNDACLAVAHIEESEPSDIDFDRQIFVLDGVSDPGNLGTIIRTLDWFGFDQLICSPDSADLYNPKVINSTMGSFTRTTICYLNLNDLFEKCDIPKYGAEMNGLNLFETKILQPSLVVMGSESHGISPAIRSKLDYSINVPKYGGAESLNVAMATGIIASYLRMS